MAETPLTGHATLDLLYESALFWAWQHSPQARNRFPESAPMITNGHMIVLEGACAKNPAGRGLYRQIQRLSCKPDSQEARGEAILAKVRAAMPVGKHSVPPWSLVEAQNCNREGTNSIPVVEVECHAYDAWYVASVQLIAGPVWCCVAKGVEGNDLLALTDAGGELVAVVGNLRLHSPRKPPHDATVNTFMGKCPDCKGEGYTDCNCECPSCDGWRDCNSCDGRGVLKPQKEAHCTLETWAAAMHERAWKIQKEALP